jgi:hypothetical protein
MESNRPIRPVCTPKLKAPRSQLNVVWGANEQYTDQSVSGFGAGAGCRSGGGRAGFTCVRRSGQRSGVCHDPSLELRIELASGTEGSLSLNSLLKSIRGKEGEAITLAAIALVILNWFAGHALLGADRGAEHFTVEQRQELTDIVQKALAGKVAEKHVQQVYREVERDPVIKGVGATPVAGERPADIVPRAEFRARAGQSGTVVEQTINRRVTTERIRVGLISPVLLPGNRRWKLQSAQGEFGAAIKDQTFINSVVLGTTSIRMKAGIEMDVELETVEEFRNGVWEIVERSVLNVNGLIQPPEQADLMLGHNDVEAEDDEE